MEANAVITEIHAIKDQICQEAGYSIDILVDQMKKEIDRSDWNYVSFPPKVPTKVTPKTAVSQ